MRHKVKKNKAYRGHQLDDDDRIGLDKKNEHRKERRVFSAGNISRYYKERVEPALKEEEKEELEYERREREAFREAWDAEDADVG